MQYFILHKPPGCLSARRDYLDRPTVYDHIPPHYPKLGHVGRLDFNTEGLLLFTDDGRLNQALLNKEFGDAEPIEKVYHVKLKGILAETDWGIEHLKEPLQFEPGRYTEAARGVRVLEYRASCTWVEVVIREGRQRQVRKLCARSNYQVRKLKRVRMGPLELGDLKMRWCRPLTLEEVEALYAAALPGERPSEYEPIDDSPEAYAHAKANAKQLPDTSL
jgi:23S rRNA pseudouridine2605 synthase